jgi:hypothetical protein
MAIEIGTVAKSVSFKYDTAIVTGDHVTVFAKNPAKEEEPTEKKTVPNDGTFALAFPMDYSGEVFIEIHGSDEGEDTATLAINGVDEGVPEGEVEGEAPPEATQLPA